MGLWIVLAVMTAVAVAAVLMPLERAPASRRKAGESDVEVYRHQLDELEGDVARGLIAPAEAESARIEISRRLLAAVRDSAVTDTVPGTGGRRRFAALGIVAAVPVFSLGLYLVFGSPDLPDRPASARLATPDATQDVRALVARVEAHLALAPGDGRGWEVLAPVYHRLGRFDDSARAWRNAIRLLGGTAAREEGYGRALAAAADGVVTAEARAAFERAVEHAPDAVESRIYLAIAAEQDGDSAGAAQRWRALLRDAPDNEELREMIAARIASSTATGGAAAVRGPTPNDIAAAQGMEPAERQDLIAGMVEGLAARLAEEGGSLDDWLRLARSYAVLDRPNSARRTIAEARARFAGDEDAAVLIDGLVRSLDLGS